MRHYIFLLVIGLFASRVGCGGGGVSVGTSLDAKFPAAPVGFAMRVENGAATAPGLQGATGTAGNFAVTSATVNLRHIDFDLPPEITCAAYGRDVGAQESTQGACESSAAGGKLRFDGPFRINLVSGERSPELTALAIPLGNYPRVDLRVDDADEEIGDPLSGVSLYLTGTWVDADGQLPIVMRMKFNEDVRFESAAHPVPVTESGGSDLAVVLPEAQWLAGVDAQMTECVAEHVGEAEILIDEAATSACKKVAGILKENFKSSGDFRKLDK